MNNCDHNDDLEYDEALSILLRGCNSYSRLPALIEMCSSMDPREWLMVLGEAWETCDNITKFMKGLLECPPFAELIKNPSAWRDHMMTIDERAALEKLPARVTIYRGCYEHNKDGLSWTTNRSVAESFPYFDRYRSRGRPLLITASISREQILAAKNDREEDEVIAWRPEIQAISHLKKP